MNCHICNAEIPVGRAEFLMETARPFVCLSCSSEDKRLTLMDYSHKTAPSLVVVPKGQEQLAIRAFKRSR